ncbi:MAG: flagellar hook-associated protein FlgK, partial [Syntrophotalea acetylenica]|nr:flagellar hook-associated protein FlgK [Syntrophotalea acetylenica]
MGLSDVLNMGKTSLATHQTLMEVTGNNIANVNSEGYSRQSVELGTVPALNFRGFQIGRGVTASNILRAQDTFLNRQILDKNSALGEQAAQTTPLAELETLFNLDEDNLSARIDRFFDSWEQLSVTPDGSVERDSVLQNATLLGDAFHAMSNDLGKLSQQLDSTLADSLSGINQKLRQVADLNQRVATVEASGVNANADRDSRDALLEELSYSLGIKSYENKDGSIDVQLQSGLPLVSGNQAFALETVDSASGAVLQVNLGTSSRPVDANSLGGEFKGLTILRNEFIPQLMDNLDQLAYSLATKVNGLHSAGTGLD